MSTNLFSKAAAYRKKHPGMTMPEAVKAMSKKAPAKKKAAVKKSAARKKPAAKKRTVGKVAAPRKLKVKIRKTKNGGTTLKISGIAGISMNKLEQELRHVQALETAMRKHQEALKVKGLKLAEKAMIKREILRYKNNIAASKKHISALKRSI